MRGLLPYALAAASGAAVYFAMSAFFESRGLTIGLAVVTAYILYGEAREYLGLDENAAKPVAADAPLLARPSVRRRLIMLLALFGALSLIVNEIFFGDFDTQEAKDWVDGLGIWGPILLITILAAAMVFAPLPNPPIMIAAGIIWGTFLGVVYSVIGQLIGAAIIFFLSRRFGRRFIPKLVGPGGAKRIDSLAKEMGPQLVFWWRMMPVSFDFAAYAAGLTAMSFRLFIVLVFFGSILPTTVIVGFGDSLDSSWTARFVLAGIVVVAVSIPSIMLYRRYREDLPPLREIPRMLLGADEPAGAD